MTVSILTFIYSLIDVLFTSWFSLNLT